MSAELLPEMRNSMSTCGILVLVFCHAVLTAFATGCGKKHKSAKGRSKPVKLRGEFQWKSRVA